MKLNIYLICYLLGIVLIMHLMYQSQDGVERAVYFLTVHVHLHAGWYWIQQEVRNGK